MDLGRVVTIRLLRAGVVAVALASAPPIDAQEFPFPEYGFTVGDSAAPVTVVEFADFGCGACAEFATRSFPTIIDEFVNPGTVQWRIIPFVLGPFRHSKRAAIAGICAAEQDRFWEFHDLAYGDQDRWQDPRDPQSAFEQMIIELGGDLSQFSLCYSNKATEKLANTHRSLARKIGVRATPAFLVNGRWALGALSAEQFGQLIHEALAP